MFRLALVFVALTLLQGVISSPISETPAIEEAGSGILGALPLVGAIIASGNLAVPGASVRGGGLLAGALGQRDDEAGSGLSEVLPVAGIIAGNGCVAVPYVRACAGGLAAGAIGSSDEPAGDDDGASGESVDRRFFFPIYVPPAPPAVNRVIGEVGAIGANGVNGITVD